MRSRQDYWGRAAMTMAVIAGCAHAQAQDSRAVQEPRRSPRVEATGGNGTIGGGCAKVNADALMLTAQGQFREAENILSAVLSNGDHFEHVCAGVTMNNIATLQQASGRPAEAEVMAERSVRTLDLSLPPNHPALLRPLQTLAAARFEQGKIARAREAFNRMESIRTTRPEDRELVNAMAAVLLEAEGRWAEAESRYIAAMEALTEAGRGDSVDAGVLLNGMGGLFVREQRMDAARQVLNEALAIFESAPDANPWDRIKVLYTRGTLCARQGEWREAERDLANALSIADREPRPNPMVVRSLLNVYATVLRKDHRPGEARLVEKRGITLGEAIEDGDVVDVSELLWSPKTLRSKKTIAH